MSIKFSEFSLNVSLQEKVLDENSNPLWVESNSLGMNGFFYPQYEEALSPLTYSVVDLDANSPKRVYESSKVLDMLFLQNIGNNDLYIGFSEGGDYPIKLKQNESTYFKGKKPTIMQQVWCKSTLGSKLNFLFISSSSFKINVTSSGYDSQLTDSNGRIVVSY